MQKIILSPTNLKGEKWVFNEYGNCLNDDKYTYFEKSYHTKVILRICCYQLGAKDGYTGWQYGFDLQNTTSGFHSGCWTGIDRPNNNEGFSTREEAVAAGCKYLLTRIEHYLQGSDLKKCKDKIINSQIQKTLF